MFDVIVFNNSNLRNYFEVIVKQKRSSILDLTVFESIILFRFSEFFLSQLYKTNFTTTTLNTGFQVSPTLTVSALTKLNLLSKIQGLFNEKPIDDVSVMTIFLYEVV